MYIELLWIGMISALLVMCAVVPCQAKEFQADEKNDCNYCSRLEQIHLEECQDGTSCVLAHGDISNEQQKYKYCSHRNNNCSSGAYGFTGQL